MKKLIMITAMFMTMSTWSSPSMYVLDESEYGTVYCIGRDVIFETENGLVKLQGIENKYYECKDYLKVKEKLDKKHLKKNSKDKND